jgi:photosystem II stability/assembly factor-like uncharacterized protein
MISPPWRRRRGRKHSAARPPLRVERLEDRRVPALTTAAWTSLGPAPIAVDPVFNGPAVAGRVSVAAADPTNPNVMYLGADHGGVWKTSDWLDPSPTWTPLTDNQPSLSFTNYSYQALAVAPGHPNVIDAAMTGPGGGILQSTDAGATWRLLGNAVFETASFGTLVVSPADPNTLYVTVRNGASQGGGVYRSTDGGQTWTNTTAFHSGGASDLVIDPTNPSVLYAGLVGDTLPSATDGVYKTTDGGQTWTQLSGGVLSGAAVGGTVRLALAPSAPQTVYATVFDPSLGGGPDGLPHRFRTADGGNSWTALTPLATEDDRIWHVLLTLDPTNAQVVYANGDDGPLYRSTDGGQSWAQVYTEDPVGGSFDAAGAFVLVGDRGVYRWTGPGTLFANKQGNLQSTEFYTVTPDPTNPNVVYGIAQDQFRGLKYSNSPVWTYLGGADEVGRILVDPTNPRRLYTYDPLNSTSFVQRSDDAGASWTDTGSGIDTSQAGFHLAYTAQKAFVMDPTNAARLLVATTKVYETTDAAGSWRALSPDLSAGRFVSALAVAPSAPNTVYAATDDGRFFVTTDDGAGGWQERDTGLPAFPFVTDIQVDPANPRRVFVVLGDFANNDVVPANVWETTDGGQSWTNITGKLPADDQTLTLAVDWRGAMPVLYVGTNRGAYRSTGASAAWTPFSTGLPNTVVSDLELVPQQNLLVAATYGRGVFEILLPGQAARLDVTAPAAAQAGAPVTVTVTARDAGGAVATAYTGTVHFTGTDAAAGLPADYTFTAADNGTRAFTVTFKTVGTQTVTAADTASAAVAGSAAVTVSAAATAQIALTAPASATAGQAFGITVRALDGFGNPDSGYRGTVRFSSTDGQAMLPASYTFTATDNGMHTFPGVTLRTAGARTVTVTDAANGAITASAPVAVAAAAVASLTLTAPPGSEAGGAFSVTVRALDPFGNTDTAYRGTVSLGSDDGQATLPAPYAFTADDAGSHTFNGVILRTAGTRTLTATAGGVTGATAQVAVTPSTGAALLLLEAPPAATAGQPFAVTVTVLDAFGNANEGYRGTVRFSSTDGLATLPANYTFTAADAGAHTFPGVTFRSAGTRTLIVTDTANGSIKASAPVAVGPAAATQLALTAPPAGTVGVPFGVVVTALDTFGDVDPTFQGTVQFFTDDGRATLPAPYTFTAADRGVHTVTGVLFGTAGLHTLTVAAPGLLAQTADMEVSPVATATLLTSSASPAVFGQAVTFTATVQATGPPAAPPSGSVTFMSAGAVLAVVPLSGGQASFTTAALTPGAYDVTAAYGGDAACTPSASGPVGQVVVDQPLTDVTGPVGVILGPLRLRRPRGQQALLLVNGSGRSLEGPVSLVVVGLRRKVKLLSATGFSGGLGGPYLDVVPPGGLFLPGQALAVTLVFDNPSGRRIRYGTRVVAGVGVR